MTHRRETGAEKRQAQWRGSESAAPEIRKAIPTTASWQTGVRTHEGLLELAVSAICLLRGGTKPALFLVAWLASSFLLYHAGLWFMGWKPPCGCLGNLGDAIHLSPRVAERTAQILSVYLLAGSVTTILQLRRSPGRLDKLLAS
jgi:hypothetical protein